MKTIRLISAFFSLSMTLLVFGHANAVDLGQLPSASETLEQGRQVLPGSEAAKTVVPAEIPATGLTKELMQQFGVNQRQAEAGAGSLFQLAKTKMSAEDFTALTDAVPEVPHLMTVAPPPSPLGGAGMTATFLEIGMKPEMVKNFIPTIVQYVESSGGSAVAAALKSALMSGM